jgi:cytoskeleton protein RodZ
MSNDAPLSDIPESQSPGRALYFARQSKGWDRDYVAKQLHLKPESVTAMEEDNYQALPGTVFIYGYMKNYARLLGLDADNLLADLPLTNELEQRPANLSTSRPDPKLVQRNRLGKPLFWLVTIVLLAMAGDWWWKNRNELGSIGDFALSGKNRPASAAMTPPDAPEVAPMTLETDAGLPPDPATVEARFPDQDPNLALDGSPADTLGDPSLPPEIAPGEDDVDDASSDQPAVIEPAPDAFEAPVTETVTNQPAGSLPPVDAAKVTTAPTDKIVFEFTATCWVNISDASRTYRLVGEMKPGDRHELGGSPPYSVILGNASGVKVSVYGTPLDIGTFSTGNVARFKLDPNATDTTP